jgi:hypothetical protein
VFYYFCSYHAIIYLFMISALKNPLRGTLIFLGGIVMIIIKMLILISFTSLHIEVP